MNAEQVEKTIRHYIDNRFNGDLSFEKKLEKQIIKQICFGDLKISIQASEFHYCTPREDCNYYTQVEIGFPNFLFSSNFIEKYAEDKQSPQNTVYGYVPIDELSIEISKLILG